MLKLPLKLPPLLAVLTINALCIAVICFPKSPLIFKLLVMAVLIGAVIMLFKKQHKNINEPDKKIIISNKDRYLYALIVGSPNTSRISKNITVLSTLKELNNHS